MQFRRWLNDGEVISPADGEKVNLYGKIAVLINGQCTTPSSQEVISAPSQLDVAEPTKEMLKFLFLKVSKVAEGGIRTRGTLRYTAFPMYNRPLCHLSDRSLYMTGKVASVNDQKGCFHLLHGTSALFLAFNFWCLPEST